MRLGETNVFTSLSHLDSIRDDSCSGGFLDAFKEFEKCALAVSG